MPGDAAAIKAGEAYVEIGGKLDKLDMALGSAQAKVYRWGQSMMRTGAKIAAFGAAMGAPLLIGVKAASDMEEALAKFGTVFRSFAPDMLDWAMEYGKAVGRSRLQMVKWLSIFQDLFVPVGFARDEAAELSKGLLKLGIDLASFNNVADDQALDNLMSGLIGFGRAVRKYGIVIDEGTLKQAAWRHGIIDTERELTQQEKYLARVALMLDMSQDAQGDAIRTADSFQNTLKRLRAAYEDLKVSIGTALIYTGAKALDVMSEMVRKADEWLTRNQHVIQSYAKLTLAVLGTGAGLIALGVAAKVAALALSPFGAVGLAVGGFVMLSDAIGLTHTGLLNFMESIRIGGHSIGTWLTAGWLEAAKGWEHFSTGLQTTWTTLTSILGEGWDGFKVMFFDIVDQLKVYWLKFSTFIVDKLEGPLQWVYDQLAKLPHMEAFDVQVGDWVSDAREQIADLEADMAARWDDFFADRPDLAKDLAGVVQGMEQELREQLASLEAAIGNVFRQDVPTGGIMQGFFDMWKEKWAEMWDKVADLFRDQQEKMPTPVTRGTLFTSQYMRAPEGQFTARARVQIDPMVRKQEQTNNLLAQIRNILGEGLPVVATAAPG
jgi:hypothetical protein